MTLAYESRTGSGRRKAAIALVALGAERAASLLKDLDESEVKAIAAEVTALGQLGESQVAVEGAVEQGADRRGLEEHVRGALRVQVGVAHRLDVE